MTTRKKAVNGTRLQKDLRAAKSALVLADHLLSIWLPGTGKHTDAYFNAYRKVMGRDSEVLDSEEI